MVKDHSDSERENPLPPHGLLFPISRWESTGADCVDRYVRFWVCACSVSQLSGDREVNRGRRSGVTMGGLGGHAPPPFTPWDPPPHIAPTPIWLDFAPIIAMPSSWPPRWKSFPPLPPPPKKNSVTPLGRRHFSLKLWQDGEDWTIGHCF